MKYYPVFLNLNGKQALVVGGGIVAERKIEILLDCGALIDIISKKLTDKLNEFLESGKICRIGESFKENHLDNVFLVIAATNDERLNHKISNIAQTRGLLVNAVDQPADCNFIVPSILRKGDLLIAISTSGKSPSLAKKIRRDLEPQFGDEYASFLTLMGRIRDKILAKKLPQNENSQIFHEIANSDTLKALSHNDWEQVESILKRILPRDLITDDFLKGLIHRRGE